jgi:hypothetical protein
VFRGEAETWSMTMASDEETLLPLFRGVIDHGLTTPILYKRARAAGDSFDEALAELERDGIPRARVSRMFSVEVPVLPLKK